MPFQFYKRSRLKGEKTRVLSLVCSCVTDIAWRLTNLSKSLQCCCCTYPSFERLESGIQRFSVDDSRCGSDQDSYPTSPVTRGIFPRMQCTLCYDDVTWILQMLLRAVLADENNFSMGCTRRGIIDPETNKFYSFPYLGCCSPRKMYDAVHTLRSV